MVGKEAGGAENRRDVEDGLAVWARWGAGKEFMRKSCQKVSRIDRDALGGFVAKNQGGGDENRRYEADDVQCGG